MQGLFYLGSIAAIVFVIYWFTRNDKLRDGERIGGLLAYKDDASGPAQTKKEKREARKWRRPKA